MEPKRILVPFVGSDDDRLAFDVARTLAERHRSHVDGLFVRPDPAAAHLYVGMDVGPQEDLQRQYREQVARDGKRAAARARRRFNAVCKKHGVTRVSKPGAGPQVTARLLVECGDTAERLPEAARLADLVVFAGHWVRHHQLFPSLLEYVLLESGTAVFFCPSGPLGLPPRRAVIAWDGSLQAARAVRAATAFLGDAKAVCVISIDEGISDPGDPRAVIDYLAWHGIAAEARSLRCKKAELGETLLAEAVAFESQLLVLGAYVHRRIQELILGGTTLHALQHSDSPLLIAH